eukprot:TRINITY_DN234_c0_g1_i7.p1 TRINITY_DN234_c0_g1~~TRINITY_DN234_c0_g1_i7.p1  ORF type:complete len:864 (+),score=192.40 TRINITY_DN234_c0_g1_i7:458-3049(+)
MGWTRLLRRVPCSKYIASNSPRRHVLRVLRALGLADVHWSGILCPDTTGGFTKANPLFYERVAESHPVEQGWQVTLVDDSRANLEVAREGCGFEAVLLAPHGAASEEHCTHSEVMDRAADLPTALARSLGAVAASAEWQFDSVRYLQSKNVVDQASCSQSLWDQLAQQVSDQDFSAVTGVATLRVLDIGAGLLSMLDKVLTLQGSFTRIEYVAFESEPALQAAIASKLADLGFRPVASAAGAAAEHEQSSLAAFSKSITSPGGHDVEVVVHVHARDIRHASKDSLFTQTTGTGGSVRVTPHLIIGCCLVDLFDPVELAQVLSALTEHWHHQHSTLLYFPISFTGRTVMEPSAPEEEECPSDEQVMEYYHESLTCDQGHHIDVDRFKQALSHHGMAVLSTAPSDWVIHPDAHPYMWRCMLHFMGLGTLHRLSVDHAMSASRWVQRMHRNRPTIRACNVDILACAHAHRESERQGTAGLPSSNLPDTTAASATVTLRGGASSADSSSIGSLSNGLPAQHTYTYIEFTGPRRVEAKQGLVQSDSPRDGAEALVLGPKQVLLKTVCSSISSGTEMKVFKGDFEDDAEQQLDTTIAGMADNKMQYPLRYGYSLVGRVVACGEEVEGSAALLGQLMFAFAPHASMAAVDASSVMPVPEGISAEDACFLPAVETALSLVQDTRVVLGEKVAVFGQGLIGLLVTGILGMAHAGAGGGKVIAVDLLDDRRKAALRLGASEAITPDQVAQAGPFDTCIEVSGSSRALQSALDNTGYGGSVIIGSWYGSTPAPLKLGLSFHRSHLKLTASQVSHIPAALSARWTKERRFKAAWELVRQIRPAENVATRTIAPGEIQEAFEALETGQHVAIIIKY